MNQETLEFIVDMLNLIFGRGEETDDFWKEIILPQCLNYFKVQDAIQYHHS